MCIRSIHLDCNFTLFVIDVAKMVLNRCTVEKLKCEPKSNRPVPNPSRDSEEYEVIFNYEFLEDYIGDWTADKTRYLRTHKQLLLNQRKRSHAHDF